MQSTPTLSLSSPSLPSPPNVAALERARAATGSTKRRHEAANNLVLSGEDLTRAVRSFFGDDVARLHKEAVTTTSEEATDLASPATDGSTPASKANALLASTLMLRLQHEGEFQPMRGLLKKRGGGSRITTWHWRFCVLHPHAIAIHDGTDRPGPIRSAVPLKHVVQVSHASAAQSGDRPFAFAVHSSVGRAWVFCCMSSADLEAWVARLKRACALRTGMGLSRALAI